MDSFPHPGTGGLDLARLPVIDFHTHVLPEMDDGSDSVETSIGMLRKLRDSGVDLAVATSHYYRWDEDIDSFLERRSEAIGKLRPHMDASCSGIVPAAEVAFYFGIEEDPKLGGLCVGDTKALLVEMPFAPWGTYEMNALSSLCFGRGFAVILAHYERFEEYQKNNRIYEEILRLPLTVQINAHSLLTGRGAKKWLRMFEEGRAHLIGSDCHNLTTRPPNLAEARQILRQKAGEEAVRKTDRRAEALLLGEKP